QVMDRGGKATPAPQCAGERARQQARPYRLGGSPQGTRLRVRQDQCAPTCLIVAPCSGPSRRGLQTPAQVAPLSRRPALTALALGAPLHARRPVRRNGSQPNKGTNRSKEVIVT